WADLRFALHPLALAVFAAIALPWMLAMQQRYPGFFDYFIVEQHFQRYTQPRFNNPQPWWFYLAVLPLGTLPLCLRLP
ncbi:dolichyl-phosphate-mannose--protein mannosyltransferase, partial [Acinetobacter baumannii]